MRRLLCLALLALACGDANATQGQLRVVARGTYAFEGSTCRLFQVEQYDSANWWLRQRFSTCDPPIPGMVGGSKPSTGKGDPDVP